MFIYYIIHHYRPQDWLRQQNFPKHWLRYPVISGVVIEKDAESAVRLLYQQQKISLVYFESDPGEDKIKKIGIADDARAQVVMSTYQDRSS